MKDLLVSIRIFIFMSALLGIGYPLLMTAVAQSAFLEKAGGSLVMHNHEIIGSHLLAQKFVNPKYFWPRPSSGDFNPLPSGGSNLGPSSADLLKATEERRASLVAANPGMIRETAVPQDLLFASASGLDPEISPSAALYQVKRVALARGLEPNQVMKIVNETTLGRQLGLLGEPRVNVLALNLALDGLGANRVESVQSK